VTTRSAAGDVTLQLENRNDAAAGLEVVVIATPAAGGGTVAINTDQATSFVVGNSFAAGAGSLSQTIADTGNVTNADGGQTGIVFATTVSTAIPLATTLNISKPIVFDATRRINTSSGTFATGGQIAIDGSAIGSNDGLVVQNAGDGTSINGFRFYGFTNSSAVVIEAGATGVSVSDSVFGLTAAQRVLRNSVGLEVLGNTATVTNCTFAGNDTGALVGTNVTGATITRSTFGTNAARVSLPNGVGVDMSGAGSGNVVSNSFFAYNSTGVRVHNVTGTSGAPTTIDRNEFVLNGGTNANAGAAIQVGGTSAYASITNNVITRGTGNGIVIANTANNVTVGTNYIGTNSRGSTGLGNRRNGVSITSTGVRNTVVENVIQGNGVGNVANEGNGVAITAAGTFTNVANTAAGSDVTGVVASQATDTFTKASHGLITGDAIRFITGSTAGNATLGATGLTADTTYFVIRVGTDTFKLATTYANATAGTPVPVNVTADPGTNLLTASKIAVFAKENHGLNNNDQVVFSANAPTGFTSATTYYVVASEQNAFSLAATLGGSAIVPTSFGSTASLAFNGPSAIVTQNTIGSNKQAGIYAAGTAWAAITGNTIESNQNGVNAQGTSKLTIGGAFGDLTPGATTANFIRKNTLFGVNVLNTAFAQIGFNSMSGNKRGGISSSPTAPTIRSVTYNGVHLVVTLGGAITANQVIHLYTAGAGASQGLTYLDRFTSAEVGAGNTLTLIGHAGIRVGTAITATISDNSGLAPTTSAFAKLVTAKRAR
jgi:hypothetical protein